MTRAPPALVVLLAFAALPPSSPVAAQANAATSAASAATLPYGHKVAVPSVAAVRRASAIAIDGRLDDAAWSAAQPITEFRQVDPDEGQPASQRTEVRFLYDDDAPYVGARMWDRAGAAGVRTRLVRRDATFDSDYFEIVIDGFHDHLIRAFFDLNPSRSKDDYIGIGTSCCDNSWDPVWQAATSIDDKGWTAEIRIPPSTSHLELLPYAVTKSSVLATAPGDPFGTGGRPTMRVGLDLEDRLTSNLTLDATINPDFGQVEVDPAVLNLSAFETFFPEKRPFFVEGSQVFNFGSFSCNFCSNVEAMSGFYSRRIGRAPTGADLATDNYAFADVPDASTILGAGKVTGRTSSGFTVGLLDAVTGQAMARVQAADGARGSQEIEPLADYFVSRVARDFDNGNLVVGGIVSGVARNIDSTFAPRLARHAEMYGNDMVYTWGDHTYAFRGSAAITNVSGDRREIALREESSARYYQRPDRGAGGSGFFTNRFDTTATSLRGGGLYARVAKETGNWMWETAVNARTPGYETNDYAFQQRADYIWYNANLVRSWSKPTSWYHSLFAIIGGQAQNNFEGDRTAAQLQAYLSEATNQFWSISTFYMHRPGELDDRQLRGGPLMMAPTSHYVESDISSDSRHRVIGSASLQYYWDQAGGVSPAINLSAEYRPRPNVAVSFGPSFNSSRSYAQYVAATLDTTATAFFGTRYVVSQLAQRTLGLDTRLSLTFSPTMTLELYAQPFFASGRYTRFGEYRAPRTATVDEYGRDRGTIASTVGRDGLVSTYTIDPDGAGPATAFTLANPDFSQQSLRGNAVFRWEYRPGSVLYVAWTQSRFADSAFGDLDFPRDRSALLAARPDNIFLMKASWWWGGRRSGIAFLTTDSQVVCRRYALPSRPRRPPPPPAPQYQSYENTNVDLGRVASDSARGGRVQSPQAGSDAYAGDDSGAGERVGARGTAAWRFPAAAAGR